MDRINIKDIKPFVSKDGSEIRELLAPRNSAIKKQSLAEARLGPGCATTRHYHKTTEEIYYITEGTAHMELGDRDFEVKQGDAIPIPPGTLHRITNTGKGDLALLCCCAPSYENDDTVLDD